MDDPLAYFELLANFGSMLQCWSSFDRELPLNYRRSFKEIKERVSRRAGQFNRRLLDRHFKSAGSMHLVYLTDHQRQI